MSGIKRGLMKQSATFLKRCRFGSVIYYYPQCDQAKLLCELARKKTLTAHDLELVQQLGYKLKFREYQKGS